MKENFTKATTSLETVFRRLGSALSLEQWKNIEYTSKISSVITINRIKRKMTQKEFAKLIGVPKRKVVEYENGDYDFTVKELCNISTKLGIKFNIIFEDDWSDTK